MDPNNPQSEQMVELAKKARKLRNRNAFTALAIGGVVLGIYGYTFFSVAQERFIDDLENEAKEARARYRKTSAS